MRMNTMIKVDALPKTMHAHAVRTGNLLFTTGQLGRNSQTGEIPAGMEAQARQTLNNLKLLLQSQHLTLEHVVKLTIYVQHIEDVAELNKVYFDEFFPEYRPARICVAVANIASNALLEMDAVINCEEE